MYRAAWPQNGFFSNSFKLFLTGEIVSKDQNTQETEWLYQSPDKLLVHYQFIVEATVARFISRGFFQPEEIQQTYGYRSERFQKKIIIAVPAL